MKTIKSNNTKLSFLKIAVIGCLAAFTIASCSNSSEQKVANAEEDVVQAEENLDEANRNLEQTRIDSIEYAKFKDAAEIEIAKNELKISNLKEDMKQEKKDLKIKYEDDLEVLKKKNSDLKSDLNATTYSRKDTWEAFKLRFNKDMEDLGQSISDLTDRNTKKAK